MLKRKNLSSPLLNECKKEKLVDEKTHQGLKRCIKALSAVIDTETEENLVVKRLSDLFDLLSDPECISELCDDLSYQDVLFSVLKRPKVKRAEIELVLKCLEQLIVYWSNNVNYKIDTLCKRLLNNHFDCLEKLLQSRQNTSNRIKCALRLILLAVTFSVNRRRISLIIATQLNPLIHLWKPLLRRRNSRDDEDVSEMMMVLVGRLIESKNVDVLKTLLNRKGILNDALQASLCDTDDVRPNKGIIRILKALVNGVLKNSFVSKTLKMSFFTPNVLKWICDALLRSEGEIKEHIEELLNVLLCSHRHGVVFSGDDKPSSLIELALSIIPKPWISTKFNSLRSTILDLLLKTNATLIVISDFLSDLTFQTAPNVHSPFKAIEMVIKNESLSLRPIIFLLSALIRLGILNQSNIAMVLDNIHIRCCQSEEVWHEAYIGMLMTMKECLIDRKGVTYLILKSEIKWILNNGVLLDDLEKLVFPASYREEERDLCVLLIDEVFPIDKIVKQNKFERQYLSLITDIPANDPIIDKIIDRGHKDEVVELFSKNEHTDISTLINRAENLNFHECLSMAKSEKNIDVKVLIGDFIGEDEVVKCKNEELVIARKNELHRVEAKIELSQDFVDSVDPDVVLKSILNFEYEDERPLDPEQVIVLLLNLFHSGKQIDCSNFLNKNLLAYCVRCLSCSSDNNPWIHIRSGALCILGCLYDLLKLQKFPLIKTMRSCVESLLLRPLISRDGLYTRRLSPKQALTLSMGLYECFSRREIEVYFDMFTYPQQTKPRIFSKYLLLPFSDKIHLHKTAVQIACQTGFNERRDQNIIGFIIACLSTDENCQGVNPHERQMVQRALLRNRGGGGDDNDRFWIYTKRLIKLLSR
ncbi:hypothetical protein ACOME3_002202 [Neoechinorhynchus agilis]